MMTMTAMRATTITTTTTTMPKLNTKSLTESELVGVNDMMPIILWIRNFLLEQGERIVEDLLLDNKSSSPWEKNGQTPSWERTRYVDVRFKRLIDITMGKINPMVCKRFLVRVTCEELVSKCFINEFGAIINVEVSCTTGVCWGLFSMGYMNTHVTWCLLYGPLIPTSR